MPEGATQENTAKATLDLKARLAAVRDRCAALRGRKHAAKGDEWAEPVASWPRDLNAPSGGDASGGQTADKNAPGDGSWGRDPAEVRDE